MDNNIRKVAQARNSPSYPARGRTDFPSPLWDGFIVQSTNGLTLVRALPSGMRSDSPLRSVRFPTFRKCMPAAAPTSGTDASSSCGAGFGSAGSGR